jgi:hypothetical protein
LVLIGAYNLLKIYYTVILKYVNTTEKIKSLVVTGKQTGTHAIHIIHQRTFVLDPFF